MAIVSTNTNLSSVSYIQGETIEVKDGAVLTVTASPSIRPGTVQCITSGKLRIENSSTTVPLIFNLDDMIHDLRFNAGGVLEIRGAPMPLAGGTGAAQTWNFATLFGGVIKHMTYVEIEEAAGSGVYMPWPIVHEDPKFNLDCGLLNTFGGATPANFTAGNTLAGQALFWHETNRTLRCGNNVEGRAVPSGCAVRIPNIFISNRLLTNQTSNFNTVLTGSPTGGSFSLTINRENGNLIGTTPAIAYNASAAVVATAIQTTTGAGTVTTSGGSMPNTAVSVTWAGAYATERLGVRVSSNLLTGGTNPQASVCENSSANLSYVDIRTLGSFDCEWCAFSDKIKVNATNYGQFRARNVGTGADSLQLAVSSADVDIDGFAINNSPHIISIKSDILAVLGSVSVKRLSCLSKSGLAGLSFSTLSRLIASEDIRCMLYGARSSGTNTPIRFSAIKGDDLRVKNITSIGGTLTLATVSDAKFVGVNYADSTTATQQLLQATDGVTITASSDIVIANIKLVGPAAPRGYLLSAASNCFNVKTFNVNILGQDNTLGISNLSVDLELKNISISGLRGGPLLDMSTTYLGKGLLASKIFATFTTPQLSMGLDAISFGKYDLVSSSIDGISESFLGVKEFVGGNYATPSLTPTTGHVTFGPFGSGSSLVLTGAAYADALGSVVMPAYGDTVVATMPFAMHGITSFQNVSPSIYADTFLAIANKALLGAPGVPTGGTFTLTVYTAASVLLGTTSALAYNATGAVIGAALGAIPAIGVGMASCSDSLQNSGVITFIEGLPATGFIVTLNQSLLTGGTLPRAVVVGMARNLDGVETLGQDMLAQFGVRVPGESWSVYQAINGANLASAISSLVGYSAGVTGLEMRVKLINNSASNPLTKINQISMPTNINPSLWALGDATITLQGLSATDIGRVIRASDNVVLYSFTGAGLKEFSIGNNFDEAVYFTRELAGGVVVMKTLPATQRLNFGDNGSIPLFYGVEVQLAQVDEVRALDALIQARLDVAVSSRMGLNDYTAPDNTGVAAIKAKTDALVNAPTLSQIEASTVLAKEATVASRLATSAYTAPIAAPTSTQNAAAVRTELAAELARIDVATSSRSTLTAGQIPAGLTVAQIEGSSVLAKEATVAGKASQLSVTALGAPLQSSAYVASPTTSEMKTAIEVSGGKLDLAMRAAISADDNTA